MSGFGSCHCFGCGRDVRQWHVPKAGRESLPVAVRWVSRVFINKSVGCYFLSFCPRFGICRELSNEAAISPRGKWFFERSQPLILCFCRRRICRKGMATNISNYATQLRFYPRFWRKGATPFRLFLDWPRSCFRSYLCPSTISFGFFTKR